MNLTIIRMNSKLLALHQVKVFLTKDQKSYGTLALPLETSTKAGGLQHLHACKETPWERDQVKKETLCLLRKNIS